MSYYRAGNLLELQQIQQFRRVQFFQVFKATIARFTQGEQQEPVVRYVGLDNEAFVIPPEGDGKPESPARTKG